MISCRAGNNEGNVLLEIGKCRECSSCGGCREGVRWFVVVWESLHPNDNEQTAVAER